MATPKSSAAIFIATICATFIVLGESTDFSIYSDPSSALLHGQEFFYDMHPQGIPYGPAALRLQDDCNLVVYANNSLSWATNTSGAGDNCYLTIDSYGVATLQHNFHYPVWRSPATGTKQGNYTFLLQWNGGLGIYGPDIWTSSNDPELSESALSNVTRDYVVYSYSVLPIGPVAEYKNLELTLQEDCNLVLHFRDTGKVLWQTHKFSDSRDCFVTLDGRGELFVKHRRREILWRSGASGESGFYILVLRYDAKLVVYGPMLWTTKPFW